MYLPKSIQGGHPFGQADRKQYRRIFYSTSSKSILTFSFTVYSPIIIRLYDKHSIFQYDSKVITTDEFKYVV